MQRLLCRVLRRRPRSSGRALRSFTSYARVTADENFSHEPRAFAERVFHPDRILPSGPNEVRVISNTTRDAQQSNLSAEMDDGHRQTIGRMIDDVYAPVTGPPGYEQVWGGTVPMFDIWKRGVCPFDELRRMTSSLPNTPVSALIRSSSLCAMSVLPSDVVDEFVRCAYAAGVDIYCNFDAHNDWRNHQQVAESVRRYGGHLQSALSWAVWHKDPTVYNVRWAVDFFRECVAMGAHSLYVKDPAGVLTPEAAGVLAAEIKGAFPDLPLVFHSHYQTGFAYMAYYEAVRNGANGVECSAGFSDGAGQPNSLSLLRAFEEAGLDTGSPDHAALRRIQDYCTKELAPLYVGGRTVRLPDTRVEETGIAGGQRSILDKELVDAGQPHLIPLIDDKVQQVRKEGGLVCQVTPVADSYAREAMRRLRALPDDLDSEQLTGQAVDVEHGLLNGGFAAGYASILIGEGGLCKSPVDPTQQRNALRQRLLAASHQLETPDEDGASLLSAGSTDQLEQSGALDELLDCMFALSRPTVLQQRTSEVSDRVAQLQALVQEGGGTLARLEKRVARAISLFPEEELPGSVAERISLLQAEVASLQEQATGAAQAVQTVFGQSGDIDTSDSDDNVYVQLLKGTASPDVYSRLLDDCPSLQQQLSQLDGHDALPDLCKNAGVITVCSGDFLSPGLEQARKDLQANDDALGLGLFDNEWVDRHSDYYQHEELTAEQQAICKPSDQRRLEEYVVLQAMYGKSVIPGLLTKFLRSYPDNPDAFPALYGEAQSAAPAGGPTAGTGGGAAAGASGLHSQASGSGVTAQAVLAAAAGLNAARQSGSGGGEAKKSALDDGLWGCNSGFRVSGRRHTGGSARVTVDVHDAEGGRAGLVVCAVGDGVVVVERVVTFPAQDGEQESADEGTTAVLSELTEITGQPQSMSGEWNVEHDQTVAVARPTGSDAFGARSVEVDADTGSVAVETGDGVVVLKAARVGASDGGDGAGAGGVGGGGACLSPMAGTVLRAPVKVGDSVKKGQVVMVVTAMKMEHVIKAGVTGTVTMVAGMEGDFVDGGAVAVEIKAEEEG